MARGGVRQRVTVTGVRLRILMALDAPRIREFQVYDGGR